MHVCDTKYGLQLPESKVCWNNLRWVGLDWVLGRCLGARLREVAKSWALLGATTGEQLGRPCNVWQEASCPKKDFVTKLCILTFSFATAAVSLWCQRVLFSPLLRWIRIECASAPKVLGHLGPRLVAQVVHQDVLMLLMQQVVHQVVHQDVLLMQLGASLTTSWWSSN